MGYMGCINHPQMIDVLLGLPYRILHVSSPPALLDRKDSEIQIHHAQAGIQLGQWRLLRHVRVG
jgi:hypothetical protein